MNINLLLLLGLKIACDEACFNMRQCDGLAVSPGKREKEPPGGSQGLTGRGGGGGLPKEVSQGPPMDSRRGGLPGGSQGFPGGSQGLPAGLFQRLFVLAILASCGKKQFWSVLSLLGLLGLGLSLYITTILEGGNPL